MTSPSRAAGPARSPVADLVRAGRALFPDLDFLAPGAVLEIAVAPPALDRLRIELPGKQYLGLQTIGVDAGGADIAALSTVELSSWWRWRADHFTVERLFDFDHPTGIVVQTDADDEPWLEVRFARPLPVSAIRLRNVDDQTSVRASGLRVLGGADRGWTVLYDQGERIRLLEEALRGRAAVEASPERDLIAALVPVVTLTMAGCYTEARRVFEALDLTPDVRRHFRAAVNGDVLIDRGLEWTGHGPQRCYRFWSEAEKLAYVEFTAGVADALASLTPHVCFGFGAVLGVVRDGDVIPHDDDLDLIVAFEPHEASSLTEGLRCVEEHLRPLGFTVRGNFSAHRHVSRKGAKHIDVFVGLFEGDSVSWYPSRRGSLTRDIMFPTSAGRLHGVTVPLPRSPLVYLERIYGPGWRRPDPDFAHTWDPAGYADLIRRPS